MQSQKATPVSYLHEGKTTEKRANAWYMMQRNAAKKPLKSLDQDLPEVTQIFTYFSFKWLSLLYYLTLGGEF